jgi:hypothetical protein
MKNTQNSDRKPGKQVREPGAPRCVLDDDAHFVLAEDLHEVVELCWRDRFELGIIHIFSFDLIPAYGDFQDLVTLDLVHKFAEMHFLTRSCGILEQAPEHDNDNSCSHPKKQVFVCFDRSFFSWFVH